MTENELIKILVQAGGGGILAAVILYIYRQDRHRSEDIIAKLGADFKQTVETNTIALTKLCMFVEDVRDHLQHGRNGRGTGH